MYKRQVLASLLLIAVLAAVALSFNLLNRLNRDATTVFEDEDALVYTPAPSPSVTPEASSSLQPSPSISPSPTPLPTPLPVSELYNQTLLTDAQKAYMEANLADDRFIHVLLVGVDLSLIHI